MMYIHSQEVTSEVCGAVRCSAPKNERETLTLAHPTREGIAELDKLFDGVLLYFRGAANTTTYERR